MGRSKRTARAAAQLAEVKLVNEAEDSNSELEESEEEVETSRSNFTPFSVVRWICG